MVKASKCCCCIPIKTGAYIIGCIHVLGVIIGIAQLDVLKIALDIFCGATFLVMVFRDSEWVRMLYFAVYLVYTAIIIVVHLIFALWDRDEEASASNTCSDIELKQETDKGWKDTPYKDMDDCRYWIRFYIALGQLFGLLIFFVVQFHFVLVLWSHYKNSLLVKSKGGCMPDVDA